MSDSLTQAFDLFQWYVIRGSGATSLLLLTASVALGVATFSKWSPKRRPRWVTRELHRNIALLAVTFTALHVGISVVHPYANVSLAQVLIPLAGPSHSLALALGTVAVDLLLAITITSGLRRRIGTRAWRAVHLSAWALWPVAALHGVTMGTDAGGWMLWVNAVCVGMFVAALLARRGARADRVERAAARQPARPAAQPAARPAAIDPPRRVAPARRIDPRPHVPGVR